MSHDIACFRCGASLASLSLPLSRQDSCPECSVHLHVCKMCRHFDVSVPRQCREDDAEDVVEKERLNFCDWFEPRTGAFDAVAKAKADRSRDTLDALFSDGDVEPEGPDATLTDAEKLFR